MKTTSLFLVLLALLTSGCCDSGSDCCGFKSSNLGPVPEDLKAWLPYQPGQQLAFAGLLDTVQLTVAESRFGEGQYFAGDECGTNKGEEWRGRILLKHDSVVFRSDISPAVLTLQYGSISRALGSSTPGDSLTLDGRTYANAVVLDFTNTYSRRKLYLAKGQGIIAFETELGGRYQLLP